MPQTYVTCSQIVFHPGFYNDENAVNEVALQKSSRKSFLGYYNLNDWLFVFWVEE